MRYLKGDSTSVRGTRFERQRGAQRFAGIFFSDQKENTLYDIFIGGKVYVKEIFA